jgi:hypothetical protein
MTPAEQSARDAILSKLKESRAEIARLLEPPPDAPGEGSPAPSGVPGGFPRSRTMKALMSGRGLGALGAVGSGLLLARPALAWRLIRMLPTSAVARVVIARIVHALGSQGKPRTRGRPAGRDEAASP